MNRPFISVGYTNNLTINYTFLGHQHPYCGVLGALHYDSQLVNFHSIFTNYNKIPSTILSHLTFMDSGRTDQEQTNNQQQ